MGTENDASTTSASAAGAKGQPAGQASTTATTTGKKKKKRTSKDQVAQQQNASQGPNAGQHQPQVPSAHGHQDEFNMYNGGPGVMYPEGYSRDAFNIMMPGEHADQPYFDRSSQQGGLPGTFEQQLSGGGPQSPPQPQPGLTPVQIAFLAANGLSIEGMPNLPEDAAAGMSLEALQEYYAPLQLPESDHQQQAAASSSSSNAKGNKKEGQSKKGKKDNNRNQAGHPGGASPNLGGANMNGWNNTQAGGSGAQGGPYGSFDPQASQYPYYDPQYYDEAQFAQYQQEQEQLPQQQQPQLNRANGSFHFHPDVPSFQPRHFSPDAQEFKPRSPILHADAPAFVPPTQSHTSSADSTAGKDEDVKAPNGFVSAAAASAAGAAEDTPKATPEDLPEEEQTKQETSQSDVQEQPKVGEGAQAETEVEASSEPKTLVEQVTTSVEETVEVMKEAASDLVTGKPAAPAEKEGEQGDDKEDEESKGVPAVPSRADQAADTKEEAAKQEEQEEEVTPKDVPEDGEDAQSPPHSTFSLLPPVTVEDVLDKAQSMADSVKETAQDAVETVQETVQSVSETVTDALTSDNIGQEEEEAEASEQHTKDNLDELDIPNEEETLLGEKSAEEAASAQETASNLDELDLPKDSHEAEIERHSKESSSTSASGSLAPEMSQYSLSPSEVEHQLTNATEAAADMPALQAEIDAVAQSSFPAPPRFEIVSQSEDQCPVTSSEVETTTSSQPEKATLEIISTSTDVCDVAVEGNSTVRLGPCSDIQIISTSEDQCNTEDETRGSRSATLDSLASIESARSFVRSTAPSPSPRQEELAPIATSTRPDVPALSIPIHTPPVVISPSTPISPTSGSPIRPTALSSPKPLSKTWQPQRPEHHRQASEAEKDEAIRLVRQLRSEPSTPLLESQDMLAATTSTSNDGTTANGSTIGESTDTDTFKFDLSGRFSELNSSKRKRGKADDNEEEEDPDKKERKVDSGEAPSLTMSIFSGSILPRKQFIVSIFASLGINLFLPFVNGVMLGKLASLLCIVPPLIFGGCCHRLWRDLCARLARTSLRLWSQQKQQH